MHGVTFLLGTIAVVAVTEGLHVSKLTTTSLERVDDTTERSSQDVGAVDDTTKPSSQDVGAVDDTTKPSSQDVGAVDDTTKPSSQDDVGAVDDTTKPSSQDVGAVDGTTETSSQNVKAVDGTTESSSPSVGAVDDATKFSTEKRILDELSSALGVEINSDASVKDSGAVISSLTTEPSFKSDESKIESSPARIPATGVVTGFQESTLLAKGFVKCYDKPYSSPTTSADLLRCSDSQFVFVGAKRSSGDTCIAVGAFGSTARVFGATASQTQAIYDPVGGAYWYRYARWSFGFASISSISLSTCDTGNLKCDQRLCWHLDNNNVGGYRAGCAIGLNGDSTWRKVIYKSAPPPPPPPPSPPPPPPPPSTGVVTNYLEIDLQRSGYVKCYDQPYSYPTTSADLVKCSSDSRLVFVGAKSSSGATYFAIGAFGATANVFRSTNSASQAIYDPIKGAYWYRYDRWSFGFASSSSITLNSCDTSKVDCARRVCWHLDNNNVGGWRAGCTTGLNGDSTWRKVIYKYVSPGPGVVINYPERSLLANGYVKCYDQPYSSPTTSADLAKCSSGSQRVFVGAKKSIGATEIAVGAFGSADNVFRGTASQSQATYDPVGGAYWYRYAGWSFGFASSSSISLSSCDTGNLNCNQRLCWHLDNNKVGGYRAGCTTGLNSDCTWRKVIYKSRLAALSQDDDGRERAALSQDDDGRESQSN